MSDSAGLPRHEVPSHEHLHPPKRETFDVPAMTNTDNKGFVRPVERYEVTDFGLYMSRTADHTRFHRLESWLLPALGLRANIFHFVGTARVSDSIWTWVHSTAPTAKAAGMPRTGISISSMSPEPPWS